MMTATPRTTTEKQDAVLFGQEEDEPRHITSLAAAAQGVQPRGAGQVVLIRALALKCASVEWRVDDTWIDRVHANAAGPELKRRAARELVDSSFGDAVGQQILECHMRAYGRH